MSETREGLLRAIRECPQDDLVRLIYADLVEEEGEPELAEFVRLQVTGGSPDRIAELWGAWPREDDLRTAFFGSHPVFGGCAVLPCECDTDPRIAQSSTNGVFINVRRGLPAEVRCPLSWWIGGECDKCDSETKCSRCGNTGRLPAHGPEVVARWPIETVTVTDRRPYRGTGGRYRFHGEMTPMDDFNLPDWLSARLVDDHRIGPGFGWYETEGEVREALSRELLKWAREEVEKKVLDKKARMV